MRFYNTLTKSLEAFVPLKAGHVSMYNCGPTVYDSQHVGNYRTFSFADTLRRYLEYRGLKVTQVMNLTDVGHLTQDQVEAGGDKMEEGLKRLRAKGVNVSDPYQVADHFIQEFFDDRKKIHLLDAHVHPRATKHVPEMIEMIAKLIQEGFAYQVGGNVYYDCSKFPSYGRLSGNTLESIKSGARIEPNPEKRHPADFALWKTDPHHLMQFDSPWGRGFPGWHIECSAMSRKYLGDTFDIHTGGEDNIFPHHECEIAQSEAFTGKPFVKFWIHARHMLWDGKKMSKSEGTFYRLRDLLDRGYSGEAIRYALVTTHYRQQVSFSMKSFDDAKGVVARLREFHHRVAAAPDGPEAPVVTEAKARFAEAMDEDLNTSGAAGVMHEFVRDVNRNLDEGKPVPGARAAFEGFMSVFGLPLAAGAEAPAEVEALARSREDARKRRDWKESDRLRDEIQKLGWTVKDTKDGSKLSKA
ncbi:MAG TPA: cysteine--tRNA ligase [Planctomycetota bacterium]|nr:cysteine--tRNA ligase [Planctomycetota bacterium]